MIFETHIHINEKDYQPHLKTLLAQAEAKGVKNFLAVSYSLKSARESIALAKDMPSIYLAVGIHPNNYNLKDVYQLEKLLDNKRIVAIGEIGLDYHYGGDKEKQKECFIAQIDLANRYSLPVIIHSRDAALDTYQILKEHPIKKGGVLHCFSYSYEDAVKFLDLGFYIAFGGAITFKNANISRETASKIPLDKLLVETDGPYLAPHPFRGQTNLPEMITLVVDKLAELHHMSSQEMAKITYDNAKRMLGL